MVYQLSRALALTNIAAGSKVRVLVNLDFRYARGTIRPSSIYTFLFRLRLPIAHIMIAGKIRLIDKSWREEKIVGSREKNLISETKWKSQLDQAAEALLINYKYVSQ